MKLFFFFLVLMQIFLFGEEVVPVAIIGSGPAGLSSALVTGKKGFATHVFLGEYPGGPLNAATGIRNWPGSVPGNGKQVIERLLDQLQKFNVQMHSETIVEVDFSARPFILTTSEGITYKAQTVVIATGTAFKELDVLGKKQGIVTYFYKSDAKRFEGLDVAVIGGGKDAVKKASLAASSARKVFLLVRGKNLEKSPKGKNIEILYEAEVREILRDEEKMTGLILSGGQKLAVDHVILAAGVVPNTNLFQGQIEMDEEGFIILEGRTQKTSVLGVFAAGNVTDMHYRQAITAAGDGTKAGYDVVEFLRRIGQ
ncbi:MAG: Thioredoxin reductase [Chlamydiae bacterium]|nr:Thioredoxin reductase [Chlamydiota bacterium]